MNFTDETMFEAFTRFRNTNTEFNRRAYSDEEAYALAKRYWIKLQVYRLYFHKRYIRWGIKRQDAVFPQRKKRYWFDIFPVHFVDKFFRALIH